MNIEADIALGLLQGYLHERFGEGFLIEVMRDDEDPRTIKFKIRRGVPDEPGAIACNARMLWAHLPMAIKPKPIEQQFEDAIYDAPRGPLYILTDAAINTCDHIYDEVMENLDHWKWTSETQID